jgi:hypothetical protein
MAIKDELRILSNYSYQIAYKKQIKHEDDMAKSLNISPKWKYYANNNIETTTNKGMVRLKNLIQCLEKFDSLGYKRSRHQIEFHKAFIAANLKNILGEDLQPNLSRLVEEFGINEIKLDIIIDTPRRFGKTMGVSLFVASFLYTQPGKSVSIYSTGRRASKNILNKIKELLEKLTGSTACFDANNVENIVVHCMDGGKAFCSSFPSSINIGVSTEKNQLTRKKNTKEPNHQLKPHQTLFIVFDTNKYPSLIFYYHELIYLGSYKTQFDIFTTWMPSSILVLIQSKINCKLRGSSNCLICIRFGDSILFLITLFISGK